MFPSASRRLGGLVQSDIRRMTRECDARGGINLGQGICNLPTPEPVARAAVEAILAGKSLYSYSEGIRELREAISAKLARKNAITADPSSEVVVTVGASGAFCATIHALLDPGDGLLVFEPYYGYHVGAAKVAGLDVQYLELQAPEFAVEEAALEAAIRPNTRAVVVCTPSNPSGKMWSRTELEALGRVAARHDLLVITDEIYEDITYGTPHLSPASLPELRERTVSIMGLSKTFSITGWRLGYAVAPAALAHSISLVSDLFYVCAATPLQHGVAAGFAMPESYYEELRASYAVKRELLCGALTEAGLPPIVPEGAYYVLADVRRLGEPTALAAAMAVLERVGVAAVPGSAFFRGAAGEGLLRFCYASELELIEEACERLRGLG
jgi:aminotransferase